MIIVEFDDLLISSCSRALNDKDETKNCPYGDDCAGWCGPRIPCLISAEHLREGEPIKHLKCLTYENGEFKANS